MSIVAISSAQFDDLEQLNDLMFALHDEHHQQCPEHFKTAEEIEQEKSVSRYIDSPECLIFVAKQQGRILGFVTGHFCELISSVSKPVLMGSIDELYVHPEARQQGVAKLLMDTIEARLIDYGVKQIFVEVWQFNQSALGLYQSLGFEHHIHWLRKPVSG